MQVVKPIERYSELTKVRNAMPVMLLVLFCANSYNSQSSIASGPDLSPSTRLEN